MFERHRSDGGDVGTILVTLTLTEGETVSGKLVISQGRQLGDVLNNPQPFLEIEPIGEDRRFLAKSQITSAKAVAPPKAGNLHQRLRDFDGFEPHDVLGVRVDAAWDEVKSAYFRLAKAYHPDRYATAELPSEVVGYLSSMARRVNAAYQTLETKHIVRKDLASQRQAPVYVTPQR